MGPGACPCACRRLLVGRRLQDTRIQPEMAFTLSRLAARMRGVFLVMLRNAFRGPKRVDQCRITCLGRSPETLKSWLT